ncbi:MAG: TonB-dependent receptor [Pseudomonadota bacterium]|nr:TonB-dependent receptor [Pseudomonadota bacterium]
MKKTSKLQLAVVFVLTTFTAGNAFSEQNMSPVSVFGSQDETQQAGSAHFISDEEIKASGYTDPERLLNRIPGVYSQTEDGFGLRSNIGMRGVATLRTQKVNILEDGILQGPAVYSNFSMYFFPDSGRMEGIEVLKGPTSIGTGPRTTAGTINFISRSIPTAQSEGHYSVTFGDDGYTRNHTYYGGNITPSLGYVFEYHDYRSDGFKSIKGTGNPGDTGFDKQSDLFKIRYTPQGSSWNQYFELSSQNTTETSNESYIGLTTAAFAADPYQRYGMSAFDQMDNDYHRYIFTHYMEPMPNMSITSKLYKTRYSRLWGKVGEVYIDPEANGVGSVTKVSLSALDMQGACNGDLGMELRACNILTGTTAMGDNEYIKRSMGHRDYGMTGVQFVVSHQVGNHDLEYGYRRHKDYRQRMDSSYQENFTIDSNNTMTRTIGGATGPGAQTGSELKDADAESWHIKDVITHGNFTSTIGLRYEDVEYNKGTMATPGSTGTASNDETMLGLSTVYSFPNDVQMFAGYHEGYSPTGYSSGNPESSDNYEVGMRISSPGSYFEAIAFLVDYNNLLESCLVANGCTGNTGDSLNAGKAEVHGIEFQYRLSDMFPGPQMKGGGIINTGIRYPLLISGLVQNSEYKTNTDDEVNQMGKSIKYIPDFQMYVSMGMATPTWDISIGAKYLDDTFTNASNTYKTGKAWIFDLNSGMNVPVNSYGISNARLFLNVDNLFDKVIVASEHNYGKRPNKPQTFMAGFSFDF